MKVPLIWLNDYVNPNTNNSATQDKKLTDVKSHQEIAESFTALGLLLDKPIEYIDGQGVLDLEHRMDRADWLSILGCARDLAAMEKMKLINPEYDSTVYPEIASENKVQINVEEEGFVSRFNTRIFKNLKNGPSPDWLKQRLELYGIPSRNLIVDITNYVMVELGQPLHAHDINKMYSNQISFRRAKTGETITTLLGEKIELDSEVWVITNGDKPSIIAGIVGGKDVAVDESTTQIVLDSGSYDQTQVRKISRKLKIYNETVLRYDKFLHPHNNKLAVNRATKLISELCGPEVEIYENEDYYPNKSQLKEMPIRLSRIKKVGGVDYGIDDVKQTLEAIDYKTLSATESDLLMQVPFFRTDVEVEDDLVADVLRIHNYANIEMEPISSAPPQDITPKIYNFENKLRDILVKAGLHEHITDPLIQKNAGEHIVELQNALTSEKDALRTTISETLRPALNTYKKHKFLEIGIFEIGLVYKLEGNRDVYENYREERKMEILYASFDKDAIYANKKLREVIATLIYELGVKDIGYREIEDKVELLSGDNKIGEIRVDGVAFDTIALMEASNEISRVKSVIPNMISEDISLVMEIGQRVGPIHSFISQFEDSVEKVEIQDIYVDEKTLGKDKKSVLIQLSINNNIKSTEKLRKELFKSLKEKFKVEIRE